MKLFDYIRVLFGSDKEWSNLTNYDKSKNDFMTRRLMSIKFPLQANMFNKLKTDSIGHAESWRLIGSKFNRVPAFIYTKTKKSTKNKKWEPDSLVKEEYLKINQIGDREFQEALMFNPNEIKKSIETLQRQMNNDVN